MYNGIGLQTPRGSGTNGYIQTNKFFVRPRPSSRSSASDAAAAAPDAIKKPNRDILEHDRKRRIELRLLSLQETLADQGYTDDEISDKIAEARKAIEAEAAAASAQKGSRNSALPPPPKRFSDTQSHQIAARKEKQLETFRAALGIKREELSSEHELQEQNRIDKAHSSENEKTDDEKKENSDNQRINQTKDVVTDKHRKDIKEHGTEKKHGSSHINDPLEDGEFRSTKKNTEEGFKHEKGNKKTGTDDSDSDSYSRKKADKYAKKQKRHDNDSYSDPDSDRDARDKKKLAGKHVTKSRRPEPVDSKFDASDERKSRMGLVDKHNKTSKSGGDTSKRYMKKHKRRDSDSDTDLDRYDQANKKQVHKHTTKSRGYDSEDSISGTSDERKSRRVPVEKHSNANKSNGDSTKRDVKKHSYSDSDSDSDRDARAKKTQVEKHSTKSRRHESEDSKSDASVERKSRKVRVEEHIKANKTGGDTTKRYVNQHKRHNSDSYSDSDLDSDSDSDLDLDLDLDLERDARGKKKQVEKHATKSRRYDSEDSKSDTSVERKSRRGAGHSNTNKSGGDTTKRDVKKHSEPDSDSDRDARAKRRQVEKHAIKTNKSGGDTTKRCVKKHSDSDSDRDARAKKKQVEKHVTRSPRHDSEDSKSDAIDERENRRGLLEKHSKATKSHKFIPGIDSGMKKVIKHQNYEEISRKHDSEDSESDSEKKIDRNDHHRGNELKMSRLDYLQKTDRNAHFEPRRDSNDISVHGSREERKRKVEDAELSDVRLSESRRHVTEEEQKRRDKESRDRGSYGRSQEHARRGDYPVDKYESRNRNKDEQRYDDAKRRRYDDHPQYSTRDRYDRSYGDDSSQRRRR